MPIGEWNDLREVWYFQALIESAKLDAGCENEHRLLTQAGHLWSDDGLGDSYIFTLDQGAPPASRSVYFTASIDDRCPWDNLRVRIYVNSVPVASNLQFFFGVYETINPLVLHAWTRWNSGMGGVTDVWITLPLFGTGGADQWGYISDLVAGPRLFLMQYYCTIGGPTTNGPAHVQQVSQYTT